MADLLAWMLSVFGFTYIVVYSKIFSTIRNFCYKVSDKLGQLIHCPLCLGFWIGLPAHFLCGSPTGNIIFDMTLASISSWIGTLLIADLQNRFESQHS